MEQRTSSEISAALEVRNVSGGSAPPIPEVVKVVRKLCEGFRSCDLNEFAAWYVKVKASWDETVARSIGHPPGVVIFTAADFAERAREARKEYVRCFPAEYSFNKSIMEKRTCIWRGDSGLWLLEKSSGIMWVGVHGADSICVVTKKGDLDRGRLIGDYFKHTTVEIVLALFRKSILCEIEDLVDPSTELHQSIQGSIKKPFSVDLVDPSGELRQSLQESIKKPFGVVSANPGISSTYNECGNEDSSPVFYEEKAIEFLTEKMNRHADFTVEETIKTAICAFQCLFPKKLKATEIEVSVVDPRYRIDDPWYRVDPEDEFTDRAVWEVPTEVYDKYLDAVDESLPGEIEEPLIIPEKP